MEAQRRRRFSAEWAAVVLALLLQLCTVLWKGGEISQSVRDLTRRVTVLEQTVQQHQWSDRQP